jgi:16S rRNA (guanine527-N7)-methyltransferase
VNPGSCASNSIQQAADILQVNVRIIGDRLEKVATEPFDVISARAFAASATTFALSHRSPQQPRVGSCRRGASAQSELDAARASWQGEFRLVPSLTDDRASIIIAEGVRPRRQREPQ